MDILFLCHRIPFPPNKGDKIRSHGLLSHLAKMHRVHVACFVDEPADMAYTDDVRRLAGGECIFIPLSRAAKLSSAAQALLSGRPITTAYFRSSRISRWVDRIARTHPIECTIVFSSAMAPYVLENQRLDPHRTIVDLVDIDSDKWRQYAQHLGPWRGWVYRREAETLFEIERLAARRFGATVLVSRHEAQSFAAMAPESAPRIHALENGVDGKYFATGDFANPFSENEVAIVMTGKMDYRPNVDGALWFATEVMPLIKRTLPLARFHAVGGNPAAALRAVDGDKLVLAGNVPDVRPYLQHAAVAVAPLRIARGVQNKVLEAMAMGRPVVATEEASRALDVTSGEQLWVAKDAESFAAAVVRAVKGADRTAMGVAARDYVERRHEWKSTMLVLDRLIEGLDGAPAGAAPGRDLGSRYTQARDSAPEAPIAQVSP